MLSCGTVYCVSKGGFAFEFVDEILKYDHSTVKASEHSFPVLLFIMLYKVVLIFEFVDEVPIGELVLTFYLCFTLQTC